MLKLSALIHHIMIGHIRCRRRDLRHTTLTLVSPMASNRGRVTLLPLAELPIAIDPESRENWRLRFLSPKSQNQVVN